MMKEPVYALLEQRFAAEAAIGGNRADGRHLDQARDSRVKLGDAWGAVEAWIGRTHASGRATVVAGPPMDSRPNEGTITFTVGVPHTGDDSAARDLESELRGLVERTLKSSRALDTEALCVLSGKLVWHVHVHLAMLDDQGNAADTIVLAGAAALLHARRPDVTIVGQTATVHSADERSPVPLAVHHVPVCTSFAVLRTASATPQDAVVLDPTAVEVAAAAATISVACNAQGEVATLYKPGGVPLASSVVVQCVRLAAERAVVVTKLLRKALEANAEQHPLSTARPVLGVLRDVTVKKHAASMLSAMASAQPGAWNATPVVDVAPPVVRNGRVTSKREDVHVAKRKEKAERNGR